jgi:hypothetical protein
MGASICTQAEIVLDYFSIGFTTTGTGALS